MLYCPIVKLIFKQSSPIFVVCRQIPSQIPNLEQAHLGKAKANTIQYKNPKPYPIHLPPLLSSSSIIHLSSSSFHFFDCLRLASRYETHPSSDICISISNPLHPSQMDLPRQTNPGPGSPEGNHQGQPAAGYVHKTSKLSYIPSRFPIHPLPSHHLPLVIYLVPTCHLKTASLCCLLVTPSMILG
jgi:hypothetical protein